MTSPQHELLLIPCCATKEPGGVAPSSTTVADPLRDLVPDAWDKVLTSRQSVLSGLDEDPKYRSGRYEKNQHIAAGPDFGGNDRNGRYLPAKKRYAGTLYSEIPEDIWPPYSQTPETTWRDFKPHILILSALYGPLHPMSHIQDYNLQISESPALRIWKKAFPDFLSSYVSTHNIHTIRFFFGTSTSYLKVAGYGMQKLPKAVRRVQYHVSGGGSRRTPRVHGQLFSKFLKSEDIGPLPGTVEEREI